jgi:signal transduction histidine kinase/CheY-like chemotaxis protein
VRRHRFAPWITGAAVALALVGTWVGVRQREDQGLATTTEVAARQAAPRLGDFVRARLTVVESLARERARNPEMSDADFVRRAEILEASFGGLLALNWIDDAGIIRVVVPEGPNQAALGRSVRDHPHAAPFFLEAERTFRPTLTDSLELFQGPRGVASYFPARVNGRTHGYVNGVFDCSDLVQESLASGVLDTYLLRVSDRGGVIFESPGFGAAARPSAATEASIAGRPWRVEVTPGPALREASRAPLADLLLLLAAVLGPAVGLFTRDRLARRREREALARDRQHLEVQMLEAQKLEAVGRLAGGVAHDFNNLLTAMIGHAELARRNPTTPEAVRRDLEVIIESAHRGATITRDLLAFSRKEVVHARIIDVAREAERARPMLQHLLREDVKLVWKVDAAAGTVRLDPSQLDRTLMNLVVNAVDAQPKGGTVTIIVESAGDDHVRVTVSDQGDGMTPDIAKRAFEPFFTTKAAGKGTGLGLASVHGMAHQAGGKVTLSTEPGSGTAVSVLLPRASGEVQSATRPRASRRARAPQHTSVLLVEDDALVRQAAERILREGGYTVLVAASADEARALVSAGARPAALFTDEVLPAARGHELARELRDALPELRVLVASGHAEDLIDEAALSAVDARFLQKPYSAEELLEALGQLCPGAPEDG